jgi:hypothetical protein
MPPLTARPLAAAAALVALACACAGARAPARGDGDAPTRTVASPPLRPGSGAPADYFPLAVGNRWTFLDRSPGQAGGTRRTIKIVERAPDGFFVDDARGALRVEGDCLRDRVRRLLCAPLQPGHSWTSVVGPSATERYEIAGAGETVTVPAGTFAGCVRVRSQVRAGSVDGVAELTYAPGVGPVRLETFAVVDGVATPQIRGELESYQVK